jgi:hypothetical protein
MPNSDTKYGLFNKRTQILTQISDGSTSATTFSNVTEAKNFFYTTNAQTVFNECCTQLQWSVENDGDGNATLLKYTMAFGTKGGNIAEADDWAGQFNSRKQALIDSTGWSENGYSTAESNSHLF